MSERPAQAGARQRRGDTPASPGRIHQHAAEVAASRSFRPRLIGCQLDDPAIADYLAVDLGDKHLAQAISDIRRELLTAVARRHPKDTHGKLDGGGDVRLR
jgi:hypothetical protein